MSYNLAVKILKMEEEYFCRTCGLTGENIWNFINLEDYMENTKECVGSLVEALKSYGNTHDEITIKIKNLLNNCGSCKQEYEELVRLDRDLRRVFNITR